MSARHDLADRFAQWVRDNGLATVWGGDVSLSSNKRCYTIGFDRPRTLDGTISVYSPKFIQVRYEGAYGRDSHVFTSEANAMEFMRLAFVEFDMEAALDVPMKEPK